MYKSLAYVGILATLAVAGTWKAVGQETAQQTTTAAVAKNHISDAERDKLMQQAMEKARQELESQKAATQAQEAVRAERKAQAAKDATAKAEQEAAAKAQRAKTEAADAAKRKLADEERMARELAESEKNASDKSGAAYDVKNLDALPPVNIIKSTAAKAADKPAEKKSEPAASKSTVKAELEAPLKSGESDEKKTAGETKKSSGSDEAKVASSGEKSSSKGEKSSAKPDADTEKSQPTKDRIVIESASTGDPDAPITIKKPALPVGDVAREAEQRAARASAGLDSDDGRAAASSRSRENGSGESQSISGRVVGLMRSSEGSARILLQADDHRMVQVVVEDGDVPAPGALIAVRGRSIGGGDMNPVISASNISIKAGEKMQQPEVIEPPILAGGPMHGIAPDVPYMPPPMPLMGGPMPMGMPPMMPGGPGPMMGPRPF